MDSRTSQADRSHDSQPQARTSGPRRGSGRREVREPRNAVGRPAGCIRGCGRVDVITDALLHRRQLRLDPLAVCFRIDEGGGVTEGLADALVGVRGGGFGRSVVLAIVLQEDRKVLVYDKLRELSMTHYSPMMGQPDEPENYHTLVYTLTPTDSGTHPALTQDGNRSEEQAEQFSRNWQSMLEGSRHTSKGEGPAVTFAASAISSVSIETALYYSDATAPLNGQRRVDRCYLRANSYP